MGILGLVGGILGFSKLGKGEKTPAAGGLMIGGVAVGFILSLVAGLGLGGAIWLIIMGGEFIGIAAILAFVAKPENSNAAATQPHLQQPVPPGQYPQQQVPGQYPQQPQQPQQPPPDQYPPQA